MVSILFLHWIRVDGSSVSADLVNMDLNCFNNSSAFSLLSIASLFPFLSGAIPHESWRFDFTYLQNGLLLLFSAIVIFT